MSLIFLKNDDRSVDKNVIGGNSAMKPYRWRNFFTTPIKIAPNSQVAFIKTQFQSRELGDFDDATIYMTVGQPELNPPIPLYCTDLNVSDFTQYVNDIGLQANLYGCDGDYNHIFVQPNQNPIGQTTLQDEYTTGFNFVKMDDKKVNIRTIQRGINDVYSQGFNSLGLVNTIDGGASPTPNGIESGTGDNTTLYKDNGMIVLGSMADNGFGTNVYGVSNVLGHYIPSVLLFPSNATSRHYNVNFAMAQMNGSGVGQPNNDPTSPIVESFRNGVSGVPYSFSVANGDGGVFGYVASTTGIKKNIFLDAPPTADRLNPNGGGAPAHASIADQGSGGYSNLFLNKNPQLVADTLLPAPLVPANRVGFAGFTPFSIGVQSADFMDFEYGNNAVSSREGFRDLMDLNDALPSAQPNPATGNLDFKFAFGGVARYMFGVDCCFVNNTYIATARVLDPQSSVIESDYITLNQLDIGELSAGYNNIDGVAFGGGAQGGATIYYINVGSPPTPPAIGVELLFRFRWTSPYTMCVEFCFSDLNDPASYDFVSDSPYLPSIAPDGTKNSDPTKGWCMLYDMKQDPDVANQYLLPSYLGDMRQMIYQMPIGKATCGMNGYFDNRFSNRGGYRDATGVNPALTDIPYFWNPPEEFSAPLVQNNFGGYKTQKLIGITPELFVPAGSTNAGTSTKQLHFLMNSVVLDSTRQFIMDDEANPIFPLYNPVNLHLGQQLGLTNATTAEKDLITLNPDILGAGTDFVEYGYNGKSIMSGGNDDFTLHFQLSNLNIQSQQAVQSTQYKSIMVVNKLELTEKLNQSYSAYNYTHPTPLWIDLNNYDAMDLNGLDVLITGDDNNEAKFLKGYTNLVVSFRAKPKSDEGYVPDNIPVIRQMGVNASGEAVENYSYIK